MMSLNSLSTIEQANREHYHDIIKTLDPEMYMIKIALEETGVNALILPRFIRALANLAMGTRYGTIRVFMQDGVVTAIKSEESDLIEREVIETKLTFNK